MTVVSCPPRTPVQHGVVVFVPATFKTLFPAFALVADGVLSFYFSLATLVLNNSCCSRVTDANVREQLLNLLTAHIASIFGGPNGTPSGLVGTVTSATEGSVSVSAELASNIPFTAAYFAQTQYGLLFWQATAPWRSFVYVAPPLVCADLEPGAGLGMYPYGYGDGCGC